MVARARSPDLSGSRPGRPWGASSGRDVCAPELAGLCAVTFANLMTVDYAGTSSTRINRLIRTANSGILARAGDPAPTPGDATSVTCSMASTPPASWTRTRRPQPVVNAHPPAE